MTTLNISDRDTLTNRQQEFNRSCINTADLVEDAGYMVMQNAVPVKQCKREEHKPVSHFSSAEQEYCEIIQRK